MQKSKPKILIISSANPTSGPGVLANDSLTAFRQMGLEADLLTLNRIDTHHDFLYVQDNLTFLGQLRHKISRLHPYYLRQRFFNNLQPKGSYGFFYREDQKPPIRSSEVLKKIKKNYDLVVIFFWQGMLSYRTIEEIYDKLHCVFRFNMVDYSPMSGGCHFTGNCEGYQHACGCCPAFESQDQNDFTHQNVMYRERVLKKVAPIITGNSYQFGFYEKSFLLHDAYRVMSFPIIDTDKFSPKNKSALRKKYGIDNLKKHLILFGSQNINDERKGISYLVEALQKLSRMLSEKMCSEVLLVAIGNDFDKLKPLLPANIDSLGLGFVSKDELPEIYSMCDMYLCSSVNDAGPMMVNQSLCCGTPVVGFAMGACLDGVKDKGTGYCAKLKDSTDFAEGIYKMLNLNDTGRQMMSEKCRKLAVDNYSLEASANRTIRQYYEYLELKK